MSQQLSPEHQELYRRVDEVLHYLWDPIGISDVPEARDEYHGYLPHVFSLLVRKVSPQELTDFLDHTATQTMGLNDTPRGRERSKEVVEILEKWREVIHERYQRNT
jgi:CubicO group peptidase (beta-lactamase class C family)